MKQEEIIEKAKNNKLTICVVGLGYVGLPLATSLAKHYKVVGYDIDEKRINELKNGIDRYGEVNKEKILNNNITYTSNEKEIKRCDVVIVGVPTPVDKMKNPFLKPLKEATKTIGKNMKKDTIVVYESTVWPGVVEDICVPILEKESKMKWKRDFNVGYSPERMNPGDKKHTLETIVKVVSGDEKWVADVLEIIYGKIVKAGIYKAPSIRVAEAAKVIENVQRDINIGLMNELAMLFNELGIDSKEVFDAAKTKWNFLPFEPGLVGGHCIPVDPYYLVHKAEEIGFHTHVILAGREVNETLPKFVAEKIVISLLKNKKIIPHVKILILGFTFKENVKDIRNTKVYDIYKYLKEFDIEEIDIYDPLANSDEVEDKYNIRMIEKIEEKYDCIIFAVKHKELIEEFDLDRIKEIAKDGALFVDIKRVFKKEEVQKKGLIYWGL